MLNEQWRHSYVVLMYESLCEEECWNILIFFILFKNLNFQGQNEILYKKNVENFLEFSYKVEFFCFEDLSEFYIMIGILEGIVAL